MAAQSDLFMHKEFADLKKHGFNLAIQFPSPSVICHPAARSPGCDTSQS